MMPTCINLMYSSSLHLLLSRSHNIHHSPISLLLSLCASLYFHKWKLTSKGATPSFHQHFNIKLWPPKPGSHCCCCCCCCRVLTTFNMEKCFISCLQLLLMHFFPVSWHVLHRPLFSCCPQPLSSLGNTPPYPISPFSSFSLALIAHTPHKTEPDCFPFPPSL